MTGNHRIDVIAGPERPILRKVALTPEGTATLEREARRLERSRHPGVVTVRSSKDGQLDLDWAGQDTLERWPLAHADIAPTIALVATTVADLHQAGVIHGRLDPTHVVVGGDGRPRLCGLRGTEPGTRREPTPADDVAAIGRLIQSLIGPGDEPPQTRRRGRRQDQAALRSLEVLAARACDDDPARRPTARALAASLADLVGEGHLPWVRDPVVDAPPTRNAVPITEPVVAPAPAPPTSTPQRRAEPVRSKVEPLRWVEPPQRPLVAAEMAVATEGRSRSRMATGAILVAAAAVVTVALTWHGPGSSTAVSQPTAISVSVPSTSTTTTVTTLAVEDRTTAPSAVVAGTRVETGGSSYVAGRPGDQVAVGDWDCDGTATAGLVRPATGEVFLFADWATAGQDVTVAPVAIIGGARELLGSPAGSPCGPPRVRLANGSVRAIPQAGR